MTVNHNMDSPVKTGKAGDVAAKAGSQTIGSSDDARQMKCLDLTLRTPAENLACDEGLLDFCEDGCGHEILRFWEPQTHFVVLGHANRVATEVDREACERLGIPVLRRCSGGGTVLQGPGCLNYSLILKFDGAGPLRTISSTNEFILKRHCAALSALVGQTVELQGQSDLALGGLKISGNAQRRKRQFLLFHGTLLLQLDLALVGTVLPMPSKQPAYRRHRPHREFLTNLGLPAESVKRAIREAWNAFEPLETFPRETTALLVSDKYATTGWNLKF